MIERRIIIGMIVSTEFLKEIYEVWDSLLLESSTARLISNWCIRHYDKYKAAPKREIETIFFQKAGKLSKEVAEEIEEDILPDLSEEFINEGFDLNFLIEETYTYLQARKLKLLGSQLENTVENGEGDLSDRVKQAIELKKSFQFIEKEQDESLELNSKQAKEKISQAFNLLNAPIITWPKQLGQFWNQHFVRGGFVSLMGPEKRGKTFWLLEIAIRALRQGRNVAFFQAGDMNEAEQLKRIGVYLCKCSNLEKYCKTHYITVRDCKHNQLNTCTLDSRESDWSPFEEYALDGRELQEITKEELIEIYENNPDYSPCYNCKKYRNGAKIGAIWLKKIEKQIPITDVDVNTAIENLFKKTKGRFKLDTHPNGTLSVDKIVNKLDKWEEKDGFIADLIIVDYMDLLQSSKKVEFRHQQNEIWKEVRKLSQTPRQTILPLVVSPTQADAGSYKKNKITMENFSEDKRKYGHVTAMFGLNQDVKGLEKELGIMRINEIVLREGEQSVNNEVTVLMDLYRGRPFLQSIFK